MGERKSEYDGYEFYNPDVKIAFIESCSKTYKNYAIKYLCMVADAENKACKDIAKFSKAEVISVLESLGYCSYSSVDKALMCIKKYLMWYEAETNDDVSGAILKMTLQEVDIAAYASQFFVKDSDEIVDMIPDFSADQGFCFVPFLLLTWAGYDGAQLGNLTDDNIVMDKDRCRVSVSFLGRQVIFGGKSAKAIIDYYNFDDNESVYIDIKKRPFRRLKYGNMFFYRYTYRARTSSAFTGAAIRRLINLKIQSGEITEKALTTNVSISGRMYRYYRDMIESGADDLTDEIIKKSHNVGDQRSYYIGEKQLFCAYRKRFNL